MEPTTPNPRGRTLAIIGAWMQIAPLIGVIGTVIGMKGAFAELGKNGASDVGALSGHIGEVLVWTVIGLSIAAVGAVLLAIAVIGMKYRRTWAIVVLAVASLNFAGVLMAVLKTLISRPV
jgi:biopolymer transport protein ExbB/TolQ